LANSITATPGTVTVHSPDQGRGEFVIHALVDPDGVAAGVREMEDHVLYALGERGDGA
jgi:multisubunit Na+/H+ antiporter MnhE subunit